MTRLVFAREPESVPFDLDGQLSEWRPAPDYGDPGHGIDTRYVGHAFASAAGYVASDLDRELVGHEAISALAIITPDYAVPGQACIVARGDAGASPDRFHGYEFGIDVRADDIGLYHRYQDSTGAEHYQEIAATGRPPKHTAIVASWCREGARLCAFVNGDLVGEVALAGAGPVITVDVPVTIGCLATITGYKRHYRGVLQYLELHAQAVTPASEQIRYQRLWTAPERWADIAESLLLPLPGRGYRDIRRATLGTIMGACAADIAQAEAGLSPATAYGPALQRWERAAGVRPAPTATVADRQATTTAAVRAPGGFSVPALRAYAAELMGVDAADVTDVTIAEGSNQLELPCKGEGPVPGPWRATGIGHAYSDAASLHLRARAGDDLGFQGFNQHGIQLAVAIPHGPGSTSNAFAVTLDNLVGSDENAWAGLVLRTHTEALWLAIFAHPDGTRRMARRRASIGQLGPWTELATLVGDIAELAVEYDPDASQWTARVGQSRLGIADAPVEWIGVTLGADPAAGPLANDLAVRVTSAGMLCGDAPVHWKWTAVCESPRYWRDEHVALLNRRSPATAEAFISRSPAMRCDDPASQLGRTPLTAATDAQLLPERAADVYRVIGMRPSYVFTYEDMDLREHIAGLGTAAANAALMTATTGPDGRPALAYQPQAFHYTANAGVIPFKGAGFAIAMICKLDGSAGRILSYWQPSQHAGLHLDYLAGGILSLTAGSPDAETDCQLSIGDHLQPGAWTAITLAIQRTGDHWRCILATPAAFAASQFIGGDFTPAARLSINRWASNLGTGLACRWLAVFEGDQVGDHSIDNWHEFTTAVARAARAY